MPTCTSNKVKLLIAEWNINWSHKFLFVPISIAEALLKCRTFPTATILHNITKIIFFLAEVTTFKAMHCRVVGNFGFYSGRHEKKPG
jgi:hypothetical protein